MCYICLFCCSDGILIENIALRFLTEVQIPEARAFYVAQLSQENTHSITYARLLNTYVSEPTEKVRLFSAIKEIPSVRKKAEWALHWISSERTFAERLVSFVFSH
jgi:ribonucleotide reductase beta subunit family protein with ferritin-like domain